MKKLFGYIFQQSINEIAEIKVDIPLHWVHYARDTALDSYRKLYAAFEYIIIMHSSFATFIKTQEPKPIV